MPTDACPFCEPEPSRVLLQGPLVYVLRDGYPISPGHCLVIPRRHVASFFQTTAGERAALLDALEAARLRIERENHPDGWNIGVNDGSAAGQTVAHLHVHLIPRFRGDCPDPRGGVRWIFPDRADYWSNK